MIAAVATVLNEADIIERVVRHLIAEGVDMILVADGHSSDGTRQILDGLPVNVWDDNDPYHYQPQWIGTLADQAAIWGADWILPFDADEFWYACERPSIKAALDELPDDVRKLHVRAWQHRDWEHRETIYRSMGKIAFRYEKGMIMEPGNHDVWLPSRPVTCVGVLDLRELQFRSYDHMARKCVERAERIDPTLPFTSGLHQRLLAAMTPEQLQQEWDYKQSLPVTYDPIPSRT